MISVVVEIECQFYVSFIVVSRGLMIEHRELELESSGFMTSYSLRRESDF